MKICLTANNSPWSQFKGGGQIITHNLANALKRAGHDVWVVYTNDTLSFEPRDYYYNIIWARHFNCAVLNFNIFSVAFEVFKLGRRIKLDIVQGSGSEAFLLSSVCRIFGGEFVMSFFGPRVLGYRFLESFKNPILLLKELNIHLFTYSIRFSKCVFVLSKFLEKMVTENIGKNPNEIYVTYPGVDADWYNNIKIKNKKIEKIVFIGRIEFEKGVDVLIKAFSQAKNYFPNISLDIIGEGNKKKEMELLAKNLQASDGIRFFPWIEKGRLQEKITEYDLAILPSRIEGFGLAIAETMAAGVPLISSETAAIPEIVENKKTGILVKAGDLESLASALTFAIENPTKIQKMAIKAQASVKEKFSWRTMAEAHVKAFKKKRLCNASAWI